MAVITQNNAAWGQLDIRLEQALKGDEASPFHAGMK
jgi:hypothetical protein